MEQITEQNFRNLTREQRGQLIAQKYRIRRTDKGYEVPSQFNKGKYLVKVRYDKKECNCPDYELRKCKCKHIHAVEYTLKKEIDKEGNTVITQTVKKTYPQNWKSYNISQQTEKEKLMELLADITSRIRQPAYTYGRPRSNLGDNIFAMVFKTYSTFSGRRFATDMNWALEKGYIDSKVPYNTMFDYFKKPELTPILAKMVMLTSLPLRTAESKFNIDSTGFGTSNFQRWYSFKHGKEICSRRWVKCHFVNGAKSNIITSVKITTENDADCPQLKEMAQDTAKYFNMEELSGDKAYLSKDNFELVNSLGGTFYVPFKSNSKGSGNGMIWKKMYHFFMLNNEEYLQHYHARSNAETTVHMIKSKFGDRVRSKLWTAQVNEVLCKIIAHNICCVIMEMNELGLESNFCPNSQIVARNV
ncbi:transposase [archaeon]|jgi:transposase|nr:transposase [archaeon]MBT4461427.1 transposase [archaeon]MBT7392879.1 transposase [archaeon]